MLEVFKDFEVVVRGKCNYGRYEAEFVIEPKTNPKTVTLKDLESYVERLRQRYPDKNFYLRRTHVKGRLFYVITRKSYVTLPNGKRKRVRDRVPIYVDLESQRFYVPASYVKKQRRLVNYIVMRTLGALGVSTSRYLRTI